MKGSRNRRDGLYDIPIEKTTMSHNNFVMSKLHGQVPMHKNIKSMQQSILFKPSSLTPKTNRTVNTMSLKKINNIFLSHIAENLKVCNRSLYVQRN